MEVEFTLFGLWKMISLSAMPSVQPMITPGSVTLLDLI